MKLQLRPLPAAQAATTARRQGGVTLVVVLILVLLVTLAGIAAVRTLVVEERMASNNLDRSLAMQSAERVLREAEDIALAQSQASPLNRDFPSSAATVCAEDGTDPSTCTNGLCAKPITGCLARWEDPNLTWRTVRSTVAAEAGSATDGNDAALSLNTEQQYIIEYLGNRFACDPSNPDDLFNCLQYRITVRTNTNTQRAVVQLQSYFLALP